MVRSLLWLGAMLALAVPAAAQQTGDPAEGRRLAERWCISCHVVEANPGSAAANGVPTFPAIAKMPGTTPMGLNAFLQTPHGRMPDLQLKRQEIDDLSAWILSLKR